MIRRMLVPFALLAATALGTAAPPPAPSDAEFAALLNTIRPAPGEDVFATIPWQTSLWAAREKAAKEGKPILLWEMDGHPLGCG